MLVVAEVYTSLNEQSTQPEWFGKMLRSISKASFSEYRASNEGKNRIDDLNALKKCVFPELR
jgi:hypothetical protein